MADFKQNVISLLADLTGVSVSEIGPETSVENLEEWDSIAHINLILSVEEKYEVTIDPEDAVELTSVGLLAEFLSGQKL